MQREIAIIFVIAMIAMNVCDCNYIVVDGFRFFQKYIKILNECLL